MGIINTQIQLFILVVIGYVAGKKGVIDPSTRKNITALVINVILPCSIVRSFFIEFSPKLLVNSSLVLIIAVAIQTFYLLVNKFLYIRFPEEQSLVLQYGTLCPNSSFIGLPVAEAVFGSFGTLYTSVALIPQRIFMWSAGLALFAEKSSKKQVAITLITNPCIIAVVVGLIIMIFRISLPSVLNATISGLGNCTTALTMIVIGSILSEVPIRSMLDWRCIYYSFFRLIVLPGVIFIVLSLCRLDNLLIGVLVLMNAMPSGTTNAILAQKYDRDYVFASKITFVSAMLSMVTLPIWSIFLLVRI